MNYKNNSQTTLFKKKRVKFRILVFCNLSFYLNSDQFLGSIPQNHEFNY